MLKNVLVDAIVRKPRQRIRNFINMNFRLRSDGRFRQSQNGLDNASQLARRQQFGVLFSADFSSRAGCDGHCFEKAVPILTLRNRSEERRVGKEWRCSWLRER